MTIGVDLDSVLAEIVTPLSLYHNDAFGTTMKPKDYVEYDLTKLWGCTIPESIERVYEFYRSSYIDGIKPIRGAKGAIRYLKEKNHELIVVTARPRFTDWVTKQWIEKHFPGRFQAIHHTNQYSHAHETRVKKSEVCKKLGVEVFFEDHIVYAEDCASENIRVFLLTMPWNRNARNLHKNITRIFAWNEIEKYL